MTNNEDRRELFESLPNAALVQEVFDLVESGTLLRGDAASAAAAAKEGVATLVDNYFEAVRMAHSQEVLFRYFMSGEGGAFIDVCWQNIMDNELADLNGKLWDMDLMDTFDAIVPAEGPNRFFKLVKQHLAAEYYQDLVEDVDSALSDCIASRLTYGLDNRFFEQLFRVYQLGGWACGWDADNQRLYANFPEAQQA